MNKNGERLWWAVIIGLLIGTALNTATDLYNRFSPASVPEVLFVDGDGFTVKRFYDRGALHYYATAVTPAPTAPAIYQTKMPAAD